MDISSIFKASVTTVKQYNKVAESSKESNAKLMRQKKQSLFFMKAQGITNEIKKLNELLMDSREAYLNFGNYLHNKGQMSDIDRDKIDSIAQHVICTCLKLIKDLKREIIESDLTQQNLEHREIMLIIIEDYFKHVCKTFSEQTAIREKKAVELRKMCKIEPANKLKSKVYNDQVSKLKDTINTEANENNDENISLKIQQINNDTSDTINESKDLSPEDIQIFETENEQLYNELNNLTEEIKQIESKVVHISELQEVFTEKILDQDKNLERILTTVVGSTENVKEANEQIREAIQRNAGLRVWVLFFLLVMSFSLIFLDWYNP